MGESTFKVMKVIENARELNTLMILFPLRHLSATVTVPITTCSYLVKRVLSFFIKL